jgi:hypothetical protein
MCCRLSWISDPQRETKQSKTMSVYSYTILMPPIFYHFKTRYFVMPNAQPNLATDASTVLDRNNCERFSL